METETKIHLREELDFEMLEDEMYILNNLQEEFKSVNILCKEDWDHLINKLKPKFVDYVDSVLVDMYPYLTDLQWGPFDSFVFKYENKWYQTRYQYREPLCEEFSWAALQGAYFHLRSEFNDYLGESDYDYEIDTKNPEVISYQSKEFKSMYPYINDGIWGPCNLFMFKFEEKWYQTRFD